MTGRRFVLLDRDEDRMPHLAADRFRQVALAADILDQDYLAGADLARFAVTRGDLHTTVEIDDVLPPWRRVPAQVVVAAGLAEDDAGRGQALGQLAAVAFLPPLHFDIAPMGLAGVVDIDVVNAHCLVPPL